MRRYGGITALLISAAAALLMLCGCGAHAYRIDYGNAALLDAAPQSARAGERVTLTAQAAPEETVWLYLDGAQLLPEGQNERQSVFSFRMPAHEVRVDAAAARENRRPKLLLAEYLEREGNQPVYGISLYTYSDSQVILEEFVGDEGLRIQYYAPIEMAQEILQFFREERLGDWKNKRRPAALSPDFSYAIRFPQGGAFAEVSTDAMPENGDEVFELLYEYLMDYLDGEYGVDLF